MATAPPSYRWTSKRLGIAAVMIALMAVLLWELSIGPTLAMYVIPNKRRKFDTIFNLTNMTVDRDVIIAGGPGIDGIPSLTTLAAKKINRHNIRHYGEHPPRFKLIAESTLAPQTRIIGLTIGEKSRAYPINILSYHEVINDSLGADENKTPIVIVYCPLCDSVTVFDRRINNQTYEFGVSGLLHNSNVLLYDRTNHALWSQLGAVAISGPNVGRPFKQVASWTITRLDAFAKAHPDAEVMTTQTGFIRDYSKDPYANYFGSDRVWFGMEPRDKTMDNKEKIVGIRLGALQRAYRLETVAKLGTLRDTLDGHDVVIQWQDDQTLRVIKHPPGAQVAHTFWFAWEAFWPKTEIFTIPME